MESGKNADRGLLGWARVLLALLAVCLAALAAPAPARAGIAPPDPFQPRPIATESRLSVAATPCLATARPGDTVPRLIAQPGRFDCSTPASRFGPGDYWLRLSPPGGATSLPLLSFEPGWQAGGALTVFHTDGTAATITLDNHALSGLATMGPRILVPLPGDASPVRSVLIRLDRAVNATGLVNGPHFVNAPERDARIATEITIYAMFGGLCLALLVYNLSLWVSIRAEFQLTYCAMLLAMQIYGWATSGAMALASPGTDLTLSFRIAYPALALVTNLSLRFFVSFLAPGRIPRWLSTLMNGVGMALVATGLTVALAPFAMIPSLDRLYAAMFLPVPVIALALAAIARKEHGRTIRVLLLAWATPVAMTLLRLANAFNLVGTSGLVEHSAVLAMSCAALLGALAIASRVKVIVEELDMARAEERIARRLADIDPLTGLLNRRALLASTIGWQSPEPLRLLLLDIDHFKHINDNHGHDAGDAVLRDLANLLAERTALRASIARIGGEEFALVGTTSELSPALALAILTDVRGHRFPGNIPVTVSIGIAEDTVRCEEDWRRLYREADTALYAAKAQGRNRVVDRADQPIVPVSQMTG